MLTTTEMESVNGGEIGTPSGGYNTDTHAFSSGSYDHFKFYHGLENHSGHGSGEPSAGQPRLLGAPLADAQG